MAVIAVFNQKGGVGKTTTCLNVAASLALLERKPIVFDLDPQAHVSLAFGVRHLPANATLAAFFREQTPLDRLVRRMPNGMRLLPGHPDLSKVDALLGSTPGVATLKNRYGERLCETHISDDPALSESPAHGMDIFAYASESPGAHDYRLLTMELLSKGFFA